MKRTTWKQFTVGLLLVALITFGIHNAAHAAYAVKQVYARFSATAGETLAKGDMVCIKDADGYAYEADANDSDLRPAIGIIGHGGSSGETVEIIVHGIFDGWSSLTEGGNGYLSETASAITQSAPSWEQKVGVAISTTEYLINCQNYFDSSAVAVLGTLTGATPIVCEGATADAYETTVAITDPTADNTVTMPDSTGAIMLSSLATNDADAANSVTGTTNGVLFEGATADAYETTLSPVDATADRTITMPDGSGCAMLSSLATNVADAANAVTGASNGVLFEGATADAYETTLSPVDPTADNTITLPNGSGCAILSSLATNVADAANSVSGTTNGVLFEGASADAYETTLSPEDATADRTITLPDYTGCLPLVIAQGSTQTSANNATQDVTGSSLTIADGWLTAGKTLKFTLWGTCTGANAAKNIILYIDDAAIVTLSSEAADVGDWWAEFTLHEHTDAAHQDAMGIAIMDFEGTITDYATDTTDFNDGGTTTVKCQVQSQNAGDTITCEYVAIEYFNK